MFFHVVFSFMLCSCCLCSIILFPSSLLCVRVYPNTFTPHPPVSHYHPSLYLYISNVHFNRTFQMYILIVSVKFAQFALKMYLTMYFNMFTYKLHITQVQKLCIFLIHLCYTFLMYILSR
jgi:hypothetical protein